MKKTRKLAALFLALTMLFSLFAGSVWGDTQTAETNESAYAPAEDAATEESGQEYVLGDLLQITVDQIAEINHCAPEDLNITYDDKGRITFIGNRFSTEKILTDDDACRMLTALMDLASLNVDLDYFGMSESQESGNRYYSFYQTEAIEPEPGVKAYIDTNAGCIKLITDREGNTIGLSSCVGGMEAVQNYPRETWVTREEAIEFVCSKLVPGEHIIDELTECSYLEDEGCIGDCGITSKRLPVWSIVTDYSWVPGWNGNLCCVSMIRSQTIKPDGTNGKEIKLAQYIPIRTPDRQGLEDIDNVYTSLAFFANMEDAGGYTFCVDEKNWVTDARKGYEFKQKNVTVPLMYDRAGDRYVLGDYNNKILVSDYYSYYLRGATVPNMIVSETPEILESWHWTIPTVKMADGTDVPLFLNMDYALSSYDTLRAVHENYHRQLGVDSYDGAGIPQMLALYMTKNNVYPTNVRQFEKNAYNFGVYRDWALMATSPAASYCADETALAHEYAHGIDRSNSALQLGNLTGSVEEAFADIMSLGVCNASYGTNNTKIVSEESPSGVMRDIADPVAFRNPRFIHDEFYVNEVDMSEKDVAGSTDNGGVHTNCAVTTYLAYSVSPANGEIQGVPLEWKELAQLFYEASFCRTTDFGYDELGAYLLFSAETLGMSKEKQDTLREYIWRYGFCADRTGLEQTLNATGIPELTVTLDMDDKLEGRTVMLTGGNYCMSVLGKDPVSFRISDAHQQERFVELLSPYVNGAKNRRSIWMKIDPEDVLMKGNVTVHVYTVLIDPGTHCNFHERIITKQENVDLERIVIDATEEGATFPKPCEILVSGYCYEDGFDLFHIICGSAEEIQRELEREKAPKTLAGMAADGAYHKAPITVINDLDMPMSIIKMVQPYEEDWGNNLLGEPLPAGATFTITLTYNANSLIWDIKAGSEDGRTYEFTNIDLSQTDPEKGAVLRFSWNAEGGMHVNFE